MSSAGIIHIAAHVDVNNESPWYSGILLAADETTGNDTSRQADETRTRGNDLAILTSEDSLKVQAALAGATYLRASDIANTEIDAQLAVLSGCNSALGRVTLGEGVIGLGGAFLSAGVRTVVASLWPVDDKVTAKLMRVFYEGLANGATISEALRAAQMAIASQSDTQQPVYWAGFVAIGNGNATVALEARPRASAPGIVILASLGLLFFSALVAMNNKRKKMSNPV